ncbi:MAG: hypothetical protein ACD_83C00210G0001 [uncultured bacterium]|nr:MAG: hypothetical protein ACD_83C00210G0001 [uncultured bacterium]
MKDNIIDEMISKAEERLESAEIKISKIICRKSYSTY